MKRLLLTFAVSLCVTVLSAQDKSNFSGEYVIKENCTETRHELPCDEISYNIDIQLNGNNLVLNKIHNQFEANASIFDVDSFRIANQTFMAFDSSNIGVNGYGRVYGDSISIYYNAGGNFGTMYCICKGVRKGATSINSSPYKSTAYLSSNNPNPFSAETEIKYYIPQNAENAAIKVYSLNGNLLLTKPVSAADNGSVAISGNELEAGTYIYTLLINGVEVDSKRMVLVK